MTEPRVALLLGCGHRAVGKPWSERKRCMICQSMQEVAAAWTGNSDDGYWAAVWDGPFGP